MADWLLKHRWEIAIALGALVFSLLWWPAVKAAAGLFVGAAVISGLLSPVVKWFEKRFSRLASVALTFVCLVVALCGLFAMLMPAIIRQFREMMHMLPDLVRALDKAQQGVNRMLMEHGLPALKLDFQTADLLSRTQHILSGTMVAAGSLLSALAKALLTLALAFYFLKDHEQMLLKLELLVPVNSRMRVLRLMQGIRHELAAYVRGQFTIAAIVGILTGAGLAIVGAPSFLVLGLVMAVCNMIPYIGPILGGIPAVTLALGHGWVRALYALLVVVVVQQLDSMVIGPRVMGSTTGIHPAAVLVAVTMAAMIAGVWGMLFVIPVLLILRCCVHAAFLESVE